ncbi:MAG: efflux RND transporter periplasmic adaptor subunit [Oligoflexus sp.]|nr:efflux RND transporter periplasmic adaptor subunit [Pseudopedobacter sp.]
MKTIILYFLALFPLLTLAHEGEDHGDEAKKTTPLSSSYFSSVSNSEKYELLLKYEPIKGGKEVFLRLFVSDFNTNKALNDAKLEITLAEDGTKKFAVKHLESGIYEVKGIFPANKVYSLNVNINSSIGPDLLVLENIEVGKELPVINATVAGGFFTSNNLLLLFGGLILGALIAVIVMAIANKRIKPKHALTIILLLSIPASTQQTIAHGGEDHGDEKKGSQNTVASDNFNVPKETQYLFNILTTTLKEENFIGTNDFLGTIIPSTKGMAVIQSPQTGKIISLRTSIGQKVNKGQVLAVIEQSIDAGTQIDLLTQRNNAEAEYLAAKAQYDRLKTIADIAAKKDVQEAEARFKSAESNRRLLRQLSSTNNGNSKLISLTAPISGIVGNFNFAIGAVINSGETLFAITDLSKVYVEAQIYSKDENKISMAQEIFAVGTTNPNLKKKLKLISKAQTVNDANQTQKYVFELLASDGDFKIGENVTVKISSASASRQLVIPNTAITEINGKQAVFVKESPESYKVTYINKGSDNGTFSTILGGIAKESKVVDAGSYQMKTMFLNQ